MPARVQKNVQPLVPTVPHQNDLLFAYAGHHEIAWIGHLALVADEEPRPRKYLLQLLLIDRLDDVDFPANSAALKINGSPEGSIPAGLLNGYYVSSSMLELCLPDSAGLRLLPIPHFRCARP